MSAHLFSGDTNRSGCPASTISHPAIFSIVMPRDVAFRFRF